MRTLTAAFGGSCLTFVKKKDEVLDTDMCLNALLERYKNHLEDTFEEGYLLTCDTSF